MVTMEYTHQHQNINTVVGHKSSPPLWIPQVESLCPIGTTSKITFNKAIAMTNP